MRVQGCLNRDRSDSFANSLICQLVARQLDVFYVIPGTAEFLLRQIYQFAFLERSDTVC